MGEIHCSLRYRSYVSEKFNDKETTVKEISDSTCFVTK